jgi:two-component system sensor histidine kinase RpfC
MFTALMLSLMAVPMYAGDLIKTLRASREHAERESRESQAKSTLLAKVSHELRTPLTGIISATELLAVEAGDESVTRRTDTILTLSNELLREINDLLDEAKFDAGAAHLQCAAMDVRQQVELVFAALEPAATKKGIALSTACDAAITGWVEADAHHLGRVLLNLAGNAVKFTDNGSVRISVDLLQDTGTAYRLRLSVTDTGIGIPESFHATIFQPFAQVEQGASRRYGGTGLGLSLSRQMVALMGGELQFESTPGKGSRFWFDVTLARCAEPAPAVSAADLSAASGAIQPRRILVAEDNVTNRLLLQELLQVDGHDVTPCDGGAAALEILAENEFDLLLLDYNLGDMDGVRVLQTYRFGRTDPVPALFLTADTTQLTASRLSEFAGDSGILYKPVTLAKLRKAIRALGAPAESENAAPVPAPVVAGTGRHARPVLTAVAVSALDPEVIAELKAVSVRPQFFPALLREAENDMRRCSQQILKALDDRCYATARDAAHALKGVSANVGAVRLFALASNLMDAPRDELEAAHERWRRDLGDALRITASAMRKEVGGENATSSDDGTSPLHLNE